MANMKSMMQDVLAKMSTMQVRSQDNIVGPMYSRVWNNQVSFEQEGTSYVYSKPAGFLEIVTGVAWEVLGEGYRKADLGLRVHLVHECMNQEGSYDEDLIIFDLRDQLIKLLHLYSPTGCGPLTAVGEEQDFSHNNVYHYIVTFLTGFVDDAGNVIQNYYIKEPPTNLDLKKQFKGEQEVIEHEIEVTLP